ncbi:Uncharacterised protein [Kluyvera cryocrescens]|uniref:Uncharacterized protein n=1 Tax=Kluyvera cryocrescens TaxID=580 RepID=A0A485D139_KLUCR|nr:Uncharacterised protein [Kluyvera cryocrescens]
MSILQPEFGRNEQFLACDAAVSQRIADLSFILIGGGSVDQAIPCFDSVNDRSLAFGCIRHLKDAKAQQGHFNTVVQL